jgi:histone chaperone ASF1
VTVILVTCSYREKEFLRVGYYVNNEYTDEFDEEQGPPKPLDFQKVVRTILADKPRVTRFHIYWGDGVDPSKGVEVEGEVEQTDDLDVNGIGNGQYMDGNVDGNVDGGFDQENGIMEDDNGEMDDEEDLDVDVDVDEEGEEDMEDEEDIEDDDMVATE